MVEVEQVVEDHRGESGESRFSEVVDVEQAVEDHRGESGGSRFTEVVDVMVFYICR